MKKFITTTLPYANAAPHIGHTFEFVLADVIADYWRWVIGKDNVRLNIGLDEHGQKIKQRADELGKQPQDYCDETAVQWKEFCRRLDIDYDNFYRTTDQQHKENALRLTEQLSEFIYERDYSGWYCVGCESYKTEKELVSPAVNALHQSPKCVTHQRECQWLVERVKCFDIKRFAPLIENRLVDDTLSNELKNIIASDFDFPITRNSVNWAIPFGEGTLHCWWEALANYIFAAGYYRDRDEFNQWWENSLQLCGKDNLKFQAYIFQAILLAAGAKQTSEILVHGIILDQKGEKMSKSVGNVVDPIRQLDVYGISPLRYYLTLGLSTYSDSAYSEKDLVQLWNNDIVGGFGNLVARTLHLVDINEVDIQGTPITKEHFSQRKNKVEELQKAFEKYDFHQVRHLLLTWTGGLNKRISDERPFDVNTPNRKGIIAEIYFDLVAIQPFYSILLKDHGSIITALKSRKKAILFQKLEFKESVIA